MVWFNNISKSEKGILGLLFCGLLLAGIMAVFPSLLHSDNMISGEYVLNADTGTGDIYDLFICQCCGKSIDTACCEMSIQGKKYLDNLLNKGLSEDAIISSMVKQYSFKILADPQMEQVAKEYIRAQSLGDLPKLEIKEDLFDFGQINQADGIITTSFKLENLGEGDLIIEGLDTSCMCTTAFLRFDGIDGPTFGMGMHGGNPEGYKLRIPSFSFVELIVSYDPMKHGIQKEKELQITREVTIISNDPVNFRKKVRIELTQIK